MTSERYVPNFSDATVQASNRRKVVTALLLAFLIRSISHLEKGRKQDTQKTIAAITSSGIPNWVIITVILMVASDFESTSDVAVAFALLILVAVLMNNGLQAFDVLQSWSQPDKTTTKKKNKKSATTVANWQGGTSAGITTAP